MTEEEQNAALLYDRDGDGKLWWPVGYVPLWLRRHQESLKNDD